MKRRSRLEARERRFGLALLGVFLAAGPAFAGSMAVSIAGEGEATVTVVGPDGVTETFKTSSGRLVINPSAGSGTFKFTVTQGGRAETGDVEVPIRGQILVLYSPDQKPALQSFVTAVEETIVTAQRVEESLQKVPAAVTALSTRDLETGQVTNIQKVSYQTPNLWMETNTGIPSGARAAIRGVGEDESFFSADTPVGIYVDDIYIPRQTGAQFDLYDLDRIEVLRGPQGTLYGRNTTAGAIKFVSRQPGNQYRFAGEATGGEFGRFDLKGAGNAPLGDKAAIQVAGMRRRLDGYDRETVQGRDVNDKDIWGARASLRILPAPKWNILLTGDLIREKSLPGFAVGFVPQAPFIGTAPPFAPNPAGFGIGKTEVTKQLDGDSDIHTIQSDLTNPQNDLDQTGFHGSISYDVSDRLTLKYIGGYRKLRNVLLLDADGRVGNFLGLQSQGRPAPTFHLFQDQDQNQNSHEIQIQGRPNDKVRYIVGGFFFHEFNEQRTENIIFAQKGLNNYWDVDLTTNSRAGFASVNWLAARRLTVNVGARYTSDSKKFNTILFNAAGVQLQHCVRPGGVVPAVPATRLCNATDPPGSVNTPVERHLEETFGRFTPNFSLDFAAKPDVFLYGTVRNGFKSGGFDGRANTGFAILTLLPIAKETLWTYEGGVKATLARSRLRINAAGFYNDWKDLQGTGTDPAGNFFRTTLGDVATKGVEFEVRAAPAEGLNLTGMLAFLRTEYKSVTFNQVTLCGSLGTGTRELELKFSPHTSYYVAADYTTPLLGRAGRIQFGGSVSGKTQFWHTSCNADTGSEDGYDLADLFAAFETRDGRLRLTATIENIWDEQYIYGSFAIAGLRMSAGYFNPPRRFSVTLRYSYN